MNTPVSVEPIPRRGQRLRRSAGYQFVQTLIEKFRVVDRAARDHISGATVLVHARADVCVPRSYIHNPAVMAPSDNDIPASFPRPALNPIDVIALDDDAAQANACRRDDFEP